LLFRSDVLLIESNPGVGTADAERLKAAGHRVHRCYAAHDPDGGHVPLRERNLCRGVTEGICPLDGGVDVALLVRRRVATRPSASEAGVSCALRAGVPVIEDGPDLLDPYEPWLTGRVGCGDVVASCEQAVHAGYTPLREDIARRIGPVCEASGVSSGEVTCRFEAEGPRLRIVMEGPPVERSVEQAIAVRVLDAVRAAGRTFGQVDVKYEPHD
jgi:hypothetical protein